MTICETKSGTEDSQGLEGRSAAPAHSQDKVAMNAHELRSPHAVMSNVLRVYRASIVPTAMPAAGDVLNRQVKRALRLVNDLMDLARASNEQLHLERCPVDLGRVVLNAAQDLEQEFRARQQALVLELLGEALWVEGDPTRLEQIVANLLENGSKYSPDGGRIRLTLAHASGQAALSVRDDGVGISAEDLPHIFEPYFRGDNAAHGSRSGLGLGLTLTHHLVRLHGGTIEARSDGAGCGSEITVRLPLLMRSWRG